MTILRKLTLKISAAVVRYASPGCKDWAEGLLQEATRIENDWSALRWALGSTRILLDRREPPITTAADASAAAHKYVELKLKPFNIWWLYFLLEACTYLLKFSNTTNRLEQAGCVMVVLASVPLGTYLYFDLRRINKLLRIDLEDELVFFEGELRRSLTLFPTLILGFSCFLFLLGQIFSLPGGVDANPVMSTFFAVVILLMLSLIVHKRRLDQRRLDQLEALRTNHF